MCLSQMLAVRVKCNKAKAPCLPDVTTGHLGAMSLTLSLVTTSQPVSGGDGKRGGQSGTGTPDVIKRCCFLNKKCHQHQKSASGYFSLCT